MKIISKFEDYYDYVGKINDTDDRVIYDRRAIAQTDVKIKGSIKRTYLENILRDLKLNYKLYEYALKYLVVFDKMYMLVNTIPKKCDPIKRYDLNNEYKLLSRKNEEHLPLIDSITNANNRYRWHANVLFYDIEEHFCRQDPLLINACGEVKHPIFVITSIEHKTTTWRDENITTVLKIDENIPVLKDLGFSSIMKPEILYQEIEYFISNVLRENPDIKPPVEISDKHKIPQHGFDVKQSFRHRK